MYDHCPIHAYVEIKILGLDHDRHPACLSSIHPGWYFFRSQLTQQANQIEEGSEFFMKKAGLDRCELMI
jgi:hypothetical protein